VLRPDLVCGVLYPRMAAPPTSTPTLLPGLRLPVARRRLGGGAALSLLVHAGVIALLVLRGRELLQRAGGGAPGERGGGAAEGEAVTFTPPHPGATLRSSRAVTRAG